MNIGEYQANAPRSGSALRAFVKRQPRLRSFLVSLRWQWRRLQYPFLILGQKRERRVAEDAMPALRGFRRGYCSIDAEMKAAFREYTGGVSFEGMPFSLESACLLWSLCEVTSPKRILDMGSGFSSYVYRRYQASARMKPEVWSVDESEEWLEKTREYLVSHELSDDNLFYLGDFQALEPGGFDLISLDLGPLEERPDIFEKLVALLNPEGLILLDDMHGAEYRIEIARRLKAHDSVVGYSVRWLTLDKFLRYCLLVRGRSGTPGS